MNHVKKSQQKANPIQKETGAPISLSKLRSKDSLEWFRFTYYAGPKAFTKAFDKLGISIDQSKPEAELKTLATLHDNGKDMSGELIGPNGPLRVDFVRFISGIQVNHNSLNNSKIQITV